jgi:hypothetical protein
VQRCRKAWLEVMGEMSAGVREEDDEKSAGDLCVWVKENVKSTGGNRLTQTCEFFLVFYYSSVGKMSPLHFNFLATDDRPKSIIHNRVLKKVIVS